MIKIITNNFWIKVICILIATGVWVYVVNSESKVDNFPGSIALEVRNKPENLVVIKNTDFVELRIVAEQGMWKKLSADTFQTYIDLAGLDIGTHELPVKVNTNVDGVQVVEINPPKVMVRLEPLISKKVPVVVKTYGKAEDGYVPGEATTNIREVEISGAESVIREIGQAFAPVRLDGESSNISNKIVSLVCYDEQNEEIKNINFNPSQAEVDLQIVRASQIKTVGIKVKTSGMPKDGFWISQITTEPSTVIITGSSRALINTEYIETESIDIEGIRSNKISRVNLNLPNGISLTSGQTNQVVANINVSALDASRKEIDAKYNYINLNPNLKISSVSPLAVKVLVSGPNDIINKLSSNDVLVNFNLESKQQGVYNENITYEMISVPESVSVINFVPNNIKIILDSK